MGYNLASIMNYLELRRFAENANAQLSPQHPCSKGNAVCCDERDVPISPGDTRFISAAIESGAIPAETVATAKANAADTERPHCPFLGPNRECTIYEFRPIVCVATGTGGIPKPESTIELEVEFDHLVRTREDRGFPVAKTGSTMCEPCYRTQVGQNARFSTGGMAIMQEVGYHYQNSQTISDVVPRLPDGPKRGRKTLPRRKQ